MGLLDQVRKTIRERDLVRVGEKVVVGVSGGPDSLTLAHVLHSLALELRLDLRLAHLNHQLRGETSDADAAFVLSFAQSLGLPATVESVAVEPYARRHHLSLEEAGRVLRYRFLRETAEKAGARVVAVGHTADDQAETIVMHLLRGSGLAGLRGMLYKSELLESARGANPEAESREPIVLVRPLLGIRRAEIEAYCRVNGLEPRMDATNLDTSLFRNRLRHMVIPYLERLNPNLRFVLAHSAEGLADDYEYIHSQVENALAACANVENGSIRFDLERWRELPVSLQRGTLREAIRRLNAGLRDINWVHVENARLVALRGKVGAEATLPDELLLAVGYGDFVIGEIAPLPDWPLLFEEKVELPIGQEVPLPGSEWIVRATTADRLEGEETLTQAPERPTWRAIFDLNQARGGLLLRQRQPGDRFQPAGFAHHKSVHDYMIDEKIPRHVRTHLPLLADEEKILWVCGYRADDRARVRAGTRKFLQVEFIRGREAS